MVELAIVDALVVSAVEGRLRSNCQSVSVVESGQGKELGSSIGIGGVKGGGSKLGISSPFNPAPQVPSPANPFGTVCTVV